MSKDPEPIKFQRETWTFRLIANFGRCSKVKSVQQTNKQIQMLTSKLKFLWLLQQKESIYLLEYFFFSTWKLKASTQGDLIRVDLI